MTTYKEKAELLDLTSWRINEIKKFFDCGTNTAIKLKKELLKNIEETNIKNRQENINEIRILNKNKIPTELFVEYFKINKKYIRNEAKNSL